MPIINRVAVSDDVSKDARLREVLVSSLRVLLVAGAILLAVVLLMSVFGLWDALLGDSLWQQPAQSPQHCVWRCGRSECHWASAQGPCRAWKELRHDRHLRAAVTARPVGAHGGACGWS
jgi:hypothetical protein